MAGATYMIQTSGRGGGGSTQPHTESGYTFQVLSMVTYFTSLSCGHLLGTKCLNTQTSLWGILTFKPTAPSN